MNNENDESKRVLLWSLAIFGAVFSIGYDQWQKKVLRETQEPRVNQLSSEDRDNIRQAIENARNNPEKFSSQKILESIRGEGVPTEDTNLQKAID